RFKRERACAGRPHQQIEKVGLLNSRDDSGLSTMRGGGAAHPRALLTPLLRTNQSASWPNFARLPLVPAMSGSEHLRHILTWTTSSSADVISIATLHKWRRSRRCDAY